MSERFYLSLVAVAFACVVALVPVSTRVAAGAGDAAATSVTNAVTADEGERVLAEGAALLRRNRADQALPLLESALKLFTQANNRSGLATAHAALGDLYLRHGQYATALEHFQRAADMFSAGRETANAALMFAKLGETYYLSGDEQAARAAFARIGEGEKRDGGTAGAGGLNAGASGGSSNNNSGSVGGATGVLTFASLSTLLPASCLSLTPNDTTPQSNGVAGALGEHLDGGSHEQDEEHDPRRRHEQRREQARRVGDRDDVAVAGRGDADGGVVEAVEQRDPVAGRVAVAVAVDVGDHRDEHDEAHADREALEQHAGGKPWPLGVRAAAEAVGTSKSDAARKLLALVRAGVLVRVRKGARGAASKVASEWRFVGEVK